LLPVATHWQGGGSENETTYYNWTRVYADIPTAASQQEAFSKFCQGIISSISTTAPRLCQCLVQAPPIKCSNVPHPSPSCPAHCHWLFGVGAPFTACQDCTLSTSGWQSKVESSGWLRVVRNTFSTAIVVANLVYKHGNPVVVHGRYGWDETCVVLTLAQLLLDPHYRTLKGYAPALESFRRLAVALPLPPCAPPAIPPSFSSPQNPLNAVPPHPPPSGCTNPQLPFPGLFFR